MLNELTYAAALARLRENEGRGLSAQSCALREKIFEVDACVESDPRVREVHPEISFTALSESPLRPKKTPSGFDQRATAAKSGIWLSPECCRLVGPSHRERCGSELADSAGGGRTRPASRGQACRASHSAGVNASTTVDARSRSSRSSVTS